MKHLPGIVDRARRFLACDRGAAGVEFLVTCPLLFGVLVFTAEYGRALQVRTVLDGAVADAARLLSRAPAGEMDDGSGGVKPKVFSEFAEEAQAIIEQRTGRPVFDGGDSHPGFEFSMDVVDTGNFRTNYYVVTVTATVQVEMPLLSLLDIYDDSPHQELGDSAMPNPGSKHSGAAIAMTARATARYLSSVPFGSTGCPHQQRMSGACEVGG